MNFKAQYLSVEISFNYLTAALCSVVVKAII